MILCDIGNTNFHFYKNGNMWKVPLNEKPNLGSFDKLYVVSVNLNALIKLEELYPEIIDISSELELNSSYVGLGSDRAFACNAITDGVIVDAGSAITVDVVAGGIHLGGYIMPGILALQKSFAISAPVLDKKFNFAVNVDVLPQNTVDAVSYGAICSVVSLIGHTAKGKMIYFTGGDGAYLSKFFENSVVDETLIFKGMLKFIKTLQ